jgi:hypothetical protein
MHPSGVEAVSDGGYMRRFTVHTVVNMQEPIFTLVLTVVVFLVIHSLFSISYPKITDGWIIDPSGIEAVSGGENMPPTDDCAAAQLFAV